jgi:hypothetical protein
MMALATAGVGVATTLAGDSSSQLEKLAKQPHSMTPAAKRQLALLRNANFSTRAGAFRYLRARGIDPRHVVIQRGTKNYAGPKCPGKGWTCTKARHVLQVGRVNDFSCSLQDCTTTQAAAGGNTATCWQTTSSNPGKQNCTINQTSTTGVNRVRVVQLILHHSNGPNGNQQATQNAYVTQASGSGDNTSDASQAIGQSLGKSSNDDDEDGNDGDDYTAAVAFAIDQNQEAHQSLVVTQGSSSSGVNTSNAVQLQGQRERADRSQTSISQRQNTESQTNNCPPISTFDDQLANACYAVQQTSATGKNNSSLGQGLGQFQAASNTPGGHQRQGSALSPESGGIDHRFTETSDGISTQTSRQVERQIQRRFNVGTMTWWQRGPVRKGTGSQFGNGASTATQGQFSTQLSSPSAGGAQTDVLVDICTSTGTCEATQQANQNGTVTNNHAGPSPFVFASIACGDVGTGPPPPPPTVSSPRWFSASAALAVCPTTVTTTTTITPLYR